MLYKYCVVIPNSLGCSILFLLFDIYDPLLNNSVFTVSGEHNKLLEAVDEVEEEVVEVDVEAVVVFVELEVEVVVFVGVEDLPEVAVEAVLGVEGDFKKKYDVLLIFSILICNSECCENSIERMLSLVPFRC